MIFFFSYNSQLNFSLSSFYIYIYIYMERECLSKSLQISLIWSKPILVTWAVITNKSLEGEKKNLKEGKKSTYASRYWCLKSLVRITMFRFGLTSLCKAATLYDEIFSRQILTPLHTHTIYLTISLSLFLLFIWQN